MPPGRLRHHANKKPASMTTIAAKLTFIVPNAGRPWPIANATNSTTIAVPNKQAAQ